MKVMVSKGFLRGYIRALDLSGTKKWPDISTDKISDYMSLRSDWENVGKFIQSGTREYRETKH